MAKLDTQQPRKTYRGTWDQVLAHSDEIPRSSEVEVRVFEPKSTQDEDPTVALLRLWLAEDATDDPDAIREAEQDLSEFKRNMNQPRKEAGARLLFPEGE